MFTVGPPGVSAQIVPPVITWEPQGYRYTERDWRRVTITNTGTIPLENTVVQFISGRYFEILGADANGNYRIDRLIPFANRDALGYEDYYYSHYIYVRPRIGSVPGSYSDTLQFFRYVGNGRMGLLGMSRTYFDVVLASATLYPRYGDWGSTDANYAQRPVIPFTLTNNGPDWLTGLTGILTSPNFEIVTRGPEELAEGESGVWTVRPVIGLVPAIYTAQFIVEGAFGFTTSAALRFQVTPLVATALPQIRNWGYVTAGYTAAAIPPQQFRITNHSTNPIPPMTLELSGTAFEFYTGVHPDGGNTLVLDEIPGGGAVSVYVRPVTGLNVGHLEEALHVRAPVGYYNPNPPYEFRLFDPLYFDFPDMLIPLLITVIPPTGYAVPPRLDFAAFAVF
jgi:hypothetical protein